MTDKLLVLTTTGSETEANKIAEMLVERRLAACVNIILRVHSVYRWQGKVQDENEVLVLLKTQVAQYEPLKARILALHPYDLPEVIAIPKSGDRKHVAENRAAVDIALTADELAALDRAFPRPQKPKPLDML